MRVTQPLFRFDVGWLFVLPGLLLLAAGVLIPAQLDLESLQKQEQSLRSKEQIANERLVAHEAFLSRVDDHDAALIRRLAASQLNQIPETDQPMLKTSDSTSTVYDWIDAGIAFNTTPDDSRDASLLEQWAVGHYRLWLFAAGASCIFIGLIIGPSIPGATRLRQRRWTSINRNASDHPVGLAWEDV